MSKITFLNEPKYSEHETDQVRNAKKKELIPMIEEFVSKHQLFKDKDVSISFSQSGVTSLVSIIESDEEKYVLKTTLTTKPVEGEGMFLKVWEECGVSTPSVIEEGILNKRPYILMNFIDSELLGHAYKFNDLISQKTYVDIGQMFSKMHSKNVKGYGFVRDGNPQYTEFSEWFPNHAAVRLEYIKEHSLLNDTEHGSIEDAIRIIEQYVTADGRSTYCHNDPSAHNIFATKPLTVFDPTPSFDHPYMDVGLAIVLVISEYGSEELVQQFIKGYFDGKEFDQKILHAFVVFNSHRRIPRWHQTNRPLRIERVKEYLKKNKHLLDLLKS